MQHREETVPVDTVTTIVDPWANCVPCNCPWCNGSQSLVKPCCSSCCLDSVDVSALQMNTSKSSGQILATPLFDCESMMVFLWTLWKNSHRKRRDLDYAIGQNWDNVESKRESKREREREQKDNLHLILCCCQQLWLVLIQYCLKGEMFHHQPPIHFNFSNINNNYGKCSSLWITDSGEWDQLGQPTLKMDDSKPE